MLSIETTKQILKDPKLSDEQAELIRDEIRSLAEIAFESFINQELNPEQRARFKNENK